MSDWELLQTMLEITAGTGAGIVGLGTAAGLARAAWRAGGQFGADLDYRNAALHAQVELEKARAALAAAQPVPQNYAPHITYSPHVANSHQSVPSAASSEAAVAVGKGEPGAVVVPTFADLLRDARVGRGQPLTLGYDLGTGTAVEGAWLDVYSSALSGMPHSGKTTSQRFMACQLALWGARFVVCDPHMQAGDDTLAATLDPLRDVYLCEPTDTPDGILRAIEYVDAIGKARVNGDKDRTPIVLWVDELNGLLDDKAIGPALVALLKETARAYRKVQVFLSCVAHTWSASSTGGSTDLRANFASRMVHRMERGQARVLVPTDLAAKAEKLEPGQAVLHTMRHSTVVQVPMTTRTDVEHVAKLLTDDAPTMPRMARHAEPAYDVAPACSRPAHDVAGDVQPAALESAALPADIAHVLQLFGEGATVNEIAQRVYGAAKSGGKSADIRKHVETLIREHYRKLVAV